LGNHALGSDILGDVSAVMGGHRLQRAEQVEPLPQSVEPRCQPNLAPFWSTGNPKQLQPNPPVESPTPSTICFSRRMDTAFAAWQIGGLPHGACASARIAGKP
jgi:hypothetical protein